MSTRSIIAVPYGDSWRGRYVHSDGYPTHMAPTLTAMVRRDGLTKTTHTLTDSFLGWSSLCSGQPDIVGVTPDPHADWGSPEYTASLFSPEDGQQGFYSGSRFLNVAGFGIAYLDEPGDWMTPDLVGWCEWVYVLSPGGLLVIDLFAGEQRCLGLFDWNTDHDWLAVQTTPVA